MSLIEKENDLIGFAHKVIGFRMNVIKACKTKGIEPPTDEQISAYINDYGLHFDDFMADYTEHEGMFRDPIYDFIKQLDCIEFGDNKPTIDEIKEYVSKHGYDVHGFIKERNLNSYKGLEKSILLSTLEMDDVALVSLWNTFIEESGLYGEDSCIYDLASNTDGQFLASHMTNDELNTICSMAKRGVRFIQWFSNNGKSIQEKNDIKGIIIAYWGEIFERMMVYPECYQELNGVNGTEYNYLADVVFAEMRSALGYAINMDEGKIVNKP